MVGQKVGDVVSIGKAVGGMARETYVRLRPLQCFASWLSMCKVEMTLINISSSN